MEVQENKLESTTIVLYTVRDIKNIFKCGINQAYSLMNSKCFPSFKINKKIYVSKDKLEEWVEKNAGKDIKIVN